jgi:hypothetical protein
MVVWEKKRAKMKDEEKEMHNRQDMRERETTQAREADRERKRERTRWVEEAGSDAIRKGKYPCCTQ